MDATIGQTTFVRVFMNYVDATSIVELEELVGGVEFTIKEELEWCRDRLIRPGSRDAGGVQ